jgi:uncharacterized protein (TIGR03089 family)
VQLGPPADEPSSARDLATALDEARTRLGNRPAVTVLSPRGREEQAVASLAQWAAKGAHLLEADLLLVPGDAVRLDAPWSWPAAAVCLAAWWAGLVVELDAGGDAEVAVLDEHVADDAGAAELLRVGDAVTGAPLGAVAGEPWTLAVQAFPDQPPRPQATPDRPAIRHHGRTWSQHEVLDLARDLGRGTLGLATDRPAGTATGEPDRDPAVVGLVALAVRPLVTGRPTVVLRGVARDAARGERVATWWPVQRDGAPA